MVELAAPKTHADRPTAKASLPFRIIRDGGNQLPRVIYYSDSGSEFFAIIEGGPAAHPLGSRLEQLMTMFWEKESEVDGLLASIDKLTTDCVLKDGEIAKLTNQLTELRSRKVK